MSDTTKRILTALVCIAMGVAIGALVTWGRLTDVMHQEQIAAEDVSAGVRKYQEIMDLVDQYYIGDQVDMTQVNDAMANGVIEGLGDRWSYYVSAEEYESYQENIQNQYVGVGITILASLDEEGNLRGYEVTDVSTGSPAMEAGIQAGFLLTRVDGADVTQIQLWEVRDMVRGEAGTTLEMGFLLPSGEEATFTVERRAIAVIPASGKMLEDHIGYITIDNFDAGCAAAVRSIAEELQDQGADALLFDVRNNPGGLKTELTELLDYLLPEGIIFHTVNYAGTEEVVRSDGDCVDLPMAVLVNASSYSAAEYFACAIQEYGVGTVVGQKTYGKGYYQVGLNLSDGSAVNLSIGKYYTPNGLSLIDVGVTPDVELELEEEQERLLASHRLDPEEDPQLQAALDVLMK